MESTFYLDLNIEFTNLLPNWATAEINRMRIITVHFVDSVQMQMQMQMQMDEPNPNSHHVHALSLTPNLPTIFFLCWIVAYKFETHFSRLHSYSFTPLLEAK
jgi:hypothetical protein